MMKTYKKGNDLIWRTKLNGNIKCSPARKEEIKSARFRKSADQISHDAVKKAQQSTWKIYRSPYKK